MLLFTLPYIQIIYIYPYKYTVVWSEVLFDSITTEFYTVNCTQEASSLRALTAGMIWSILCTSVIIQITSENSSITHVRHCEIIANLMMILDLRVSHITCHLQHTKCDNDPEYGLDLHNPARKMHQDMIKVTDFGIEWGFNFTLGL